MSVYLIAMVRVDDPDTYSKYTALTPGIIEKHGGRFIVRGGPVETIEGEAFKDRIVIVEFPNAEALKTFYASQEYQKAMVHRQASSKATFLLVEGVEPGVTAPEGRVVKSG